MVEANKVSYQMDEFHSEGLDHNKALHVTVKCGDKIVSKVLINGGFGVNICPLSTLWELSIVMGEI